MAPKSKATPRKSPQARQREELSTEEFKILKNVGKATLLLILAGVSSPISQLSMSPVYGSIPSAIFHQRALTGTALLAFMVRQTLKKRFLKNAWNFIPVVAYWIPTIQFYLFSFSAQLGPVYGPFITEVSTYFPLLFLAVYSAGELLEALDLRQLNLNSTVTEMVIPVSSYAIVSMTSKAAASHLPNYMGAHAFLTRSGLQLLVASIFAAASTSFWIVLTIPAMLHTVWRNPHYHGPGATALLNSTLAIHNYTILERQESLTGYVSVLEDHTNYFRVLRCDHSLLGGNWLITPERVAQGITTWETLYSVFTMLEAVRLVEVPIHKPDAESSALVIGLGIGTAPGALIAHGINTTIVELDPAVHYFATKYFGLPTNHTAAIMDAVTFVDEVSAAAPASYDYIIHDVFTGGAEPAALFTLEFLQGLRTILRKNGVIAINYAGDMSLPSTQMVLNTIHTVFPTCRIYRDSLPTNPSPSGSDFINMVVFCTRSTSSQKSTSTSTSKTKPLRFRQPTEADFLGSMARRNYLYPKPEHEVKYDFKSAEQGAVLLRKGHTRELERHQNEGALSHWRIMRTVLPDVVWENW